jgi:hypothetical protein
MVECHRCGNPKMALTKLDYEQYAAMDEKSRQDYVDSWKYIHRNL